MIIVNTLERQARVRIYIKDLKLYLISSLGAQNFLDGKDNTVADFEQVSWWDIHPLEAGKPEKGYRLSNQGFFISQKHVEVPDRSTAIELLKDEEFATIFYARAESESSSTFVLATGQNNDSDRALTLHTHGTLGQYHLLIPTNKLPTFQHFSPKGNLQPIPYELGERIGGGVVFYVNEDGSEARVVALKDQGQKINWADSLELCENLELNGYSDWHAPSISDLKYMELNLDEEHMGDFDQEHPYWSFDTYKDDDRYAWTFFFISSGSASPHYKVNLFNIRAVRTLKAE